MAISHTLTSPASCSLHPPLLLQLRCSWRTAQEWEGELREFGWQGRWAPARGCEGGSTEAIGAGEGQSRAQQIQLNPPAGHAPAQQWNRLKHIPCCSTPPTSPRRFPCLHAPGANLLDPPLHLALQLRHQHIAEARLLAGSGGPS